jgi:seryl-tRNA(Sec) selenium transferase
MIDVGEITDLHARTVAQWHTEEIRNDYSGFLELVCQQHMYNYLLWHEEDVARSPNVGDERIAAVKRAIDRYNQQRNDAIEKLDGYLMAELAASKIAAQPGATQNTETPGTAIDRLSIMALRRYHMQEQADREDATPEHRAKARERLAILAEQHADLSRSLAELVADIFAGRKRMKVYFQFKMYNDPTMNPYLYKPGGGRAES